MTDVPRVRPISIDVGQLVQRSVATLYSHLVTRPTGRAVRMAIEQQIAEATDPTVSLIDLSEVTVLDFSCADEVVAKLLLRYLGGDRPVDAFFMLRGVQETHRDPLEVVLDREGLVIVISPEGGGFELLGVPTVREGEAWAVLEERGRILGSEVENTFPPGEHQVALEGLISRRLAFRDGQSGDVHALSSLVRDLG